MEKKVTNWAKGDLPLQNLLLSMTTRIKSMVVIPIFLPVLSAKPVNYQWMDDGWHAILCPFLTVFQSYQDDVWTIMKGCVQWNSIYGWEYFTLSEDRTRSARSVSQRLTYWATGAPLSITMYHTCKVAVSQQNQQQYQLGWQPLKIVPITIIGTAYDQILFWQPLCVLQDRSTAQVGKLVLPSWSSLTHQYLKYFSHLLLIYDWYERTRM